jgi:hypothetical protein
VSRRAVEGSRPRDANVIYVVGPDGVHGFAQRLQVDFDGMPSVRDIGKPLLLDRHKNKFVAVGVCEMGDTPVTVRDRFKGQMPCFMISKPHKSGLVDNEILHSVAAN